MAFGRRTRDRLGADRGGVGHQLEDQFDPLSHQAFDLSQCARDGATGTHQAPGPSRLDGTLCAKTGREQVQQPHLRKQRYSITSSARATRLSGTVRPSAFAVFRLITSSYLVGACTGRSAGFSPLRIRST